MYGIGSHPLFFWAARRLFVAADGDGKAMSDFVSTSYSFPKKWRSGNVGVLIAALGLAAVLAIKLLWIKTGLFDAMSTDDAMRLVEVRDLINGQGWFDLWQYRLDPPGVLMHWSRVIDLPLTVSILLLKPLIGLHDAEAVTLFLWEMRGTGGASMVAAPIFAAAAVIVWPSLAIGRSLVLLAFVVSPTTFLALRPLAKPLTDLIFKPELTVFEPASSRCLSVSDAASMRQLPKGRVMAPIDLGPAILAETNHDVFAAPYHRNNDGNLAMFKLMLAPPPIARQMLSDRHVDYVVICRTAPNRDIIERAPDGLEARLARGETPEFLEPIDLGQAAKISAWRPRK
jgi:hypothetical protein